MFRSMYELVLNLNTIYVYYIHCMTIFSYLFIFYLTFYWVCLMSICVKCLHKFAMVCNVTLTNNTAYLFKCLLLSLTDFLCHQLFPLCEEMHLSGRGILRWWSYCHINTAIITQSTFFLIFKKHEPFASELFNPFATGNTYSMCL